jgi:TRAP-type C4-dicarboxylate transport system substrate-binding protein
MAKETRQLEVVLGKALFSLEQTDKPEDKDAAKEAAKEAWKNGRKEYKKKARRLLTRLERRGYTIVAGPGADKGDESDDAVGDTDS